MGIRASIAALVAGLLAAAVVPSGGASAEAGEGYRGDRVAVSVHTSRPTGGAPSFEVWLRDTAGDENDVARDGFENGDAPFHATLDWTRDGDEIVYWAGTWEHRELRAVGPGRASRLLAPIHGVLSPDERWVASVDRDGRLAVQELDGRRETRLLVPAGAEPPLAWDPESSRIAWGRGALHVVDLSGRLTRLTPDGQWVASASWSPNGRDLAALIRLDPVDCDDPPAYELWLVAADGRSRRQVTSLGAQGRTAATPCNDDTWAYAPAWSPDGSHVAIHVDEATQWRGIHSVDLATRQVTFVTRPYEHRGLSFTLDWSPDGRAIAADSGEWDSGGSFLQFAYTVDVETGSSEALGPDHNWNAFHPAFSPGLVTRLAGRTRVQTAVAVSRHAFAAAGTAVLARADLYPDALTGAPLAAKHGGPLLLTGAEGLHPDVGSELVRLGTGTVYLLGSEAALSRQVADDLAAMGVRVVRLGGVDRFATSRLVAAEIGGADVYVVEGKDADPNRGWPDAVAVAGLAAFEQRPILLVETEVLPPETARALDDLGASHATIVGGVPAVSEEVRRAIERRDVATDRLAGSDRFSTSAAVAEASVAAGMDPAGTWFASGRNWPDALGAGPAAAATGDVLVLVDGRDLGRSPGARRWLEAYAGSFERVRFTGGPDVLSPVVALETERRGRG